MNDNGNRSLEIYLEEIAKDNLLSDEQERALAAKIAEGDEKAIEKLTTANLKFVVKMTKQYHGKGLNTEDLICEGNIGLMKAARKFKPDCGKRFVVFAAPYIRQAMEKAIDQQAGLYKVPKDADSALERKKSKALSADAPLGGRQNVNLMGIIPDNDASMADENFNDTAIVEEITKALDMLDDRQKEVVTGFYGIGCHHKTMAEIATDMGLKRERVRQIRDKAIIKLCKKSKQLKELLKV